MSQSAAVLFVNDAFYEAFRNRDLETMDALWAHAHPVSCIHPGWRGLSGREAVMESWLGILGNDNAPQILSGDAEAVVMGESAFVTCYEVIGDTVLVATNIFCKEEDSWKLVHHQAGPCDLGPDDVEAAQARGELQ